MQMWLVTLPGKARIFLRELKNLALLEFIPYNYLFGIETEEKSAASEEHGIERFGTNHIVSAMGAMSVIGSALAGLVVLLFILWFLSKRFTSINKLYLMLKRKLQYSAVLRFVLQSTVKFQIAACTVICYDRLTSKEIIEPTSKD